MQAAQADKAGKRAQLTAQLRERQDAAFAAAKAEAEKPKRFHALDTNAARTFAESLRFRRYDLELESPVALNRPTVKLLDHLLNTLASGHSSSVL